ncbi:MAG: hypothetical protein ACODAU_10990 [Myxococcota bacterium]
MVRDVAAAVLAVTIAGHAAAQPDEASRPEHGLATLRWTQLEGADGCLDAPALHARVEDLMGMPVWGTDTGRITVEGWVVPARPPRRGFVAGLAFLDSDGHVLRRDTLRTSAENCRVLDAALLRRVAGTLASETGRRPPAGERGAALANPRDGATQTDLGFNPYRPQAPEAERKPRQARAPRAEPLTNPYAGVPHPDAKPEPYFNPYLDDAPRVAQAEPPPPGGPFDPDFNPYYDAPPPAAAPLGNPYRP